MRIAFAFTCTALCAVGADLLPTKDFVENWRTSAEFTLAVADAMPAGKYSFKVNEKEMSFGVLMVHIADSQRFRFAQIVGDKDGASGGPLKELTKEMILERLRESFRYCVEKLKTMPAEKLDQEFEVRWYGREKVTGRQLVLGMFTHTAHHRAQAEVYLRANDIAPPLYRF